MPVRQGQNSTSVHSLNKKSTPPPWSPPKGMPPPNFRVPPPVLNGHPLSDHNYYTFTVLSQSGLANQIYVIFFDSVEEDSYSSFS